MKTFQATIGKSPVIVNDNLKNFTLFKKASSNIDYFATNKSSKQFFVQFNNGKCFLHSDLLAAVLDGAEKAESIGKYYHANIKGTESVAIEDRCIRPDLGDDDDDEGHDFDISEGDLTDQYSDRD